MNFPTRSGPLPFPGRRGLVVLVLWGLVGLVFLMLSKENHIPGGVYQAKRRTDITYTETYYKKTPHEIKALRRPDVEPRAVEENPQSTIHSVQDGKTTTNTTGGRNHSIARDATKQVNTTVSRNIHNTTNVAKASNMPRASAHGKIHDSTRMVPAVNKTRSIAFVHVGKNGGNTVRMALPRLKCRRLPGGLRKQMWCFKNTWRRDSPLSQQANAEMHMNNIGPTTDILRKDYTTFLFALRNPVTRAVSAYHYLHHDNKKSTFAQKKHPLKDRFYKTCFPKLQDLLETLEEIEEQNNNNNNSKDNNMRTTNLQEANDTHDNPLHPRHCQRMAVTVLKGSNPRVKHINVHLKDNYEFYYEKTVKALPDKEVLVIRTEHLWDDLKELDVALGGPGVFEREGKVLNHNNNNNRKGKDDNTNGDASSSSMDPRKDHQMKDLCCVLVEEMKIYQEILNRAINFSYHRKLQTMYDVWASCGITSHQITQYMYQQAGDAGRGNATTTVNGSDAAIINFSWSRWHDENCPVLTVGMNDDLR